MSLFIKEFCKRVFVFKEFSEDFFRVAEGEGEVRFIIVSFWSRRVSFWRRGRMRSGWRAYILFELGDFI